MPLDFANENWIRIYKRDTVTLKLLTWQARALLWELLRKADRAGVIDTGEHAERGIAALVSMPLEVVTETLRELVAAGVVLDRGDCLVFPRFIEAQETPASDKKRMSDLRERRRDIALRCGTSRDTASRSVTARNGHDTKRNDDVTKRNDTVTDGYGALLKEKKEDKEHKRNETLSDAELLWAEQDALRAECIPGAKPLKFGPKARKAVLDCIAEIGLDGCRASLAQYASESKRNPEARQWFNGETNWRVDNARRAAGRGQAIGQNTPSGASEPRRIASATDLGISPFVLDEVAP